MIISHKHKFIFIKIRKCAGSSIEAYLAQHCGADDIITPMQSSAEYDLSRNWEGTVPWWRIPLRIGEMYFWQNPIQHHPSGSQRRQIINGNFFNHIRARDIKSCIPRNIWNSYFKFCCERNPWDKLLSRYCWSNRNKDQRLPNNISPDLFDEFIKHSSVTSPYISDFSFYSDASGKVLADRVMRFERLDDDFGAVCQQLGIPFSGKLNIQLKRSNKKEKLQYQHIYTEEQKNIVAKSCAKEIALFNYHF